MAYNSSTYGVYVLNFDTHANLITAVKNGENTPLDGFKWAAITRNGGTTAENSITDPRTYQLHTLSLYNYVVCLYYITDTNSNSTLLTSAASHGYIDNLTTSINNISTYKFTTLGLHFGIFYFSSTSINTSLFQRYCIDYVVGERYTLSNNVSTTTVYYKIYSNIYLIYYRSLREVQITESLLCKFNTNNTMTGTDLTNTILTDVHTNTSNRNNNHIYITSTINYGTNTSTVNNLLNDDGYSTNQQLLTDAASTFDVDTYTINTTASLVLSNTITETVNLKNYNIDNRLWYSNTKCYVLSGTTMSSTITKFIMQ